MAFVSRSRFQITHRQLSGCIHEEPGTAADVAHVEPGATVVVVGDGAVGRLGVLSPKLKGAERIIAMSRHPSRQKLAREFGAMDIDADAWDLDPRLFTQPATGWPAQDGR